MIAQKHLKTGKTPLEGQNAYSAAIVNMPYAGYTSIVKTVFDKIPLSLFIDGMLNYEGLQRLQDKFTEEFDDPEALVKFGKKLRDLYKPIAKQKK